MWQAFIRTRDERQRTMEDNRIQAAGGKGELFRPALNKANSALRQIVCFRDSKIDSKQVLRTGLGQALQGGKIRPTANVGDRSSG